jgi:ubiquinone biosynthesis protein UbiJ
MDYLLPDGPRRRRLGEISGDTSLDGEIRAARLVAEEMLATGSPAAQAVLATIGRLCERDQAMALRSRSLLTANQLQSLMKWVGDCLTETAREFLPEQDAMRLLDRFQARWTKAFAAFREQGQVPKLTSEARKES